MGLAKSMQHMKFIPVAPARDTRNNIAANRAICARKTQSTHVLILDVRKKHIGEGGVKRAAYFEGKSVVLTVTTLHLAHSCSLICSIQKSLHVEIWTLPMPQKANF
jgi:hypothetical protein